MRPNLTAPLQSGAPVVQTTTTTQVVKETVKVDEYREETDFYYTKERLSYIGLIRNLGFLAIAVSIASLVLASIHLANHNLDFAKVLVAACCLFLIGSVVAVYWSTRATKAFKASHDLFQPQLGEGLSRTVFIAGLVLAGLSAFVLTHLLVEAEYSPDYARAQNSSDAIWDSAFPGRTEEGLTNYFRKHFIIQGALVGFLFFYFLLAARAAFNCLKFGNQAMSHLVFLGSFLLLVFSLCVIFFADYAFEYAEYPQLRSHFPVWNIRGLYFVAIALTAVAVTGFLVDHRSWRVGFFVLAFLLLVLMVILATFTGFAYRNTRQTYQYYKGIPDVGTCLNRMNLVHSNELEEYGCPTKYLPAHRCTSPIEKWEQTGADNTNLPPRIDETPEAEAADQEVTAASARQAAQQAAQRAAEAAAEQQASAAATQQAAQQAADAAAQQQAAADAQRSVADQQQQQADQAAAQAAQQQQAAEQQQAAADQQAAAADQQAAAADQQQAAADQAAANQPAAADQPATADQQAAADQPATADAAAGTMMAFSDDAFMSLADYSTPLYCLNPRCCGIQGQLYSKHLIQLAAFGLLATLAAGLVSIGCYYFWYVTWVDSGRDKRRDFVWLGLMGLSILVFIVLFFALDRNYIAEKTGDGPRQLEMW